jgi:hypothetical protein
VYILHRYPSAPPYGGVVKKRAARRTRLLGAFELVPDASVILDYSFDPPTPQAIERAVTSKLTLELKRDVEMDPAFHHATES